MKLNLNFSALVTSAILAGVAFSACNHEGVIEADEPAPAIILDSESGVYTAKIGQEITIAPDFENVNSEDILWTMDDVVVNIGPTWTISWPEAGEYYATVTATNRNGKASEDIRIDVLEATPPVISLVIPDGGLRVAPGVELILTPDIQHADEPGFDIEWLLDDKKVCDQLSFTFCSMHTGTYHLAIIASNCDGSDRKDIDIVVTDDHNYIVKFVPLGYDMSTETIYNFAGRKVCLAPIVIGFDNPEYKWTVNNETFGSDSSILSFTPKEPGRYKVRLTVSERMANSSTRPLSRNAETVDDRATAELTVVCVDATETERLRSGAGAVSPTANTVFEWVPAPGQFINDDSSLGGMSGNETSMAMACAWAKNRLDNSLFVSLGAFGGYITVGFDHSILAGENDYDFAITGNAYLSQQGGSNEAGIVWVMQDVNGNGLPDDQWYELAGSEYDNAQSIKNYALTYYRPSGPRMDTHWTDITGATGVVRYMPLSHLQDFYYPAWISNDSYTLYGTKIPPRNYMNSQTGKWINAAYEWGYADNIGSDNLTPNATANSGQQTGFKISNARYADGTAVNLKYIDFIKVQTAVLANSGILGEISTEVCGFTDL